MTGAMIPDRGRAPGAALAFEHRTGVDALPALLAVSVRGPGWVLRSPRASRSLPRRPGCARAAAHRRVPRGGRNAHGHHPRGGRRSAHSAMFARGSAVADFFRNKPWPPSLAGWPAAYPSSLLDGSNDARADVLRERFSRVLLPQATLPHVVNGSPPFEQHDYALALMRVHTRLTPEALPRLLASFQTPDASDAGARVVEPISSFWKCLFLLVFVAQSMPPSM